MEKIVRVKAQMPLKTRNWTSQSGQTVVINSVELVLTDGIDTFVAEATDQLALTLAQQPLSSDYIYHAQCRCDVREWESQTTHEKMRSNGIRLLRIVGI